MIFFRSNDRPLNVQLSSYTICLLLCVDCVLVELLKFDRIFVETEIAVLSYCLGPYHVESTSSRPITEVKQHWAALVLGWVTAWEYAVP